MAQISAWTLCRTVSSRPAEISAYREHSIAALDSVDPANASTFDEDKSGGVDKHNRLASPGSEGVEEDGAPKTDPDPFAYSDGAKDKPGLYDNNITFVSSMNGLLVLPSEKGGSLLLDVRSSGLT